MRILMPSIVDPTVSRIGAATVTRSLLHVLESPELSATVECAAIRPPSAGLNHALRQGTAVARSLVTPLPAKVAFTYSRSFRDRVVRLLREDHFDLVILNGSDLLWLDQVIPSAVPRILVAHNIEHLVFAEQAALAGDSYRIPGPGLRRECRRMESFETSGIRSVGNVIFLSSFDAAHPRAGGLASRCVVVPPLFVDRPVGRKRVRHESGVLQVGFMGNMVWWPNRLGLSWFLKRVFPHLGDAVHLHLYGAGMQAGVTRDTRISPHGPVDDLTEVWTSCDIMICPARAGGGVSIKLAEAVYHGMPVLATTLATRGLPLADDPCLAIRDTPEEWISYLTSPQAGTVGRISQSLSSRFAVDAHRESVQNFVRETV